VRGVLGTASVTTVFSHAAEGVGVAQARLHARSLLDLFDVESVGTAVLVAALAPNLEYGHWQDRLRHPA